jgi:hypothetical protein
MQVCSAIFQLIGGVLAVIGAVQMANGYVGVVPKRALLDLLFSALVKGDVAKGSVEVPPPKENRLDSLQGLSLIGLGFLAQTIGTIFSLLALLP